MGSTTILYRAGIAHFVKESKQPQQDLQYFKDGALVVEGERIVALGNHTEISAAYPNALTIDYRDKLIIPGLIDSHLHYPQTEMMASYGEQLISWLNTYTFPTEHKFHDFAYCQLMAKHFVDQLICNGTTTAFAYTTTHKHATDALFMEASSRNMSMISGKVCMDRHCPDNLKDTPESAQKDSDALINKWHQKGRNLYALTPRFAPTSSDKQLETLGELAQQHPSVFVQTHLSENQEEVAWVKDLFPKHKSYLDVYDSFNLVHSRSLFGHCLHLQSEEWQRLAETKATAVFCPTSNMFLGSGLFNLQQAKEAGVSVALATDVGGGTSFNMLSTYGEAYKVSQLQQYPLSALDGLYMMTQGPALAYGLSTEIGNLNPNTYADFVVLNPRFSALSTLRTASFESIEDVLFALSFIGDERAIEATYIAGQNCKHLVKEKSYALA